MNNETKLMKTEVGVAAYLRLFGWRVVGRRGRDYFFEIKIEEEDEFNRTTIEFLNSNCHEYDSQIMALKKMPNYMP